MVNLSYIPGVARSGFSFSQPKNARDGSATLLSRYNTRMSSYPEPDGVRSLAQTLRSLPPEYADASLGAQIAAHNSSSGRKVVVLDDDPTGPQAMSDVFTLTGWSVESLRRELCEPRPLFFVLTNTRSLPAPQAVERVREIAAAVREAARLAGVDYTLMIRGDSTLRGHFPLEEDALGSFDGRVLIPFFAEGGRYTLDDIQWVAETDSQGAATLVPAALTPYARDIAFGYQHSNLHNWIVEKSAAAGVPASSASVSLPALRMRGPQAAAEALLASRRQTTIFNAMSYRDLEVAALGLLLAEQSGMHFIVRCAASFVRVRAGQSNGLGLAPSDHAPPGSSGQAFPAPSDSPPLAQEPPLGASAGGLVIVGSHVPRSSEQLHRLLQEKGIVATELNVALLRGAGASREVTRIGEWVNEKLADGANVVVYTSREVDPRGTAEGLAIRTVIAGTLVDIVRSLTVRPRFMVAKGGWTSSEIGIHGLGVRRAYSPAPIIPGVPLWQLGPETRFPSMPYVIFPGNVGAATGLIDVVRRLRDKKVC